MNESFWWENEEKFELREIYFQEKNMKIDHAVMKIGSSVMSPWIAWISRQFDF